MKRMSPRRLRRIRERHKHARKPTRINLLNEVWDDKDFLLFTVHDEPGWQFWLNAHDDVTALLKYVETLKKRIAELHRLSFVLIDDAGRSRVIPPVPEPGWAPCDGQTVEAEDVSGLIHVIVPVGYILEPSVPLTETPVGWLPLDGRKRRREDYPELAALFPEVVDGEPALFKLPCVSMSWIKARK